MVSRQRIRIFVEALWNDEIGLASRGFPLALASRDFALKTIRLQHSFVEVPKVLRISSFYGITDPAIVRNPPIPINFRIWRQSRFSDPCDNAGLGKQMLTRGSL